MIRTTDLFDSALVRVERIDHPPGAPHVDPREEVAQGYSINFLEAGHFDVTVGGRHWRVGPREVFVTAPGQVQTFAHEERHEAPGDVCVAVSFKAPAHDELHARFRAAGGVPRVSALTNRRAYLRHRLLEALARPADSLAIDVIAGELVADPFDPNGARVYAPSQLAWYARRVDAARQRMDVGFAADHPLACLARDAGMSPYHFARVFRDLAGLPPHRYLLRRRLAAAAARLRDGARVTDTCFAVGFQSLSHFIHSFRRAYGVAPSKVRTHRSSLG